MQYVRFVVKTDPSTLGCKHLSNDILPGSRHFYDFLPVFNRIDFSHFTYTLPLRTTHRSQATGTFFNLGGRPTCPVAASPRCMHCIRRQSHVQSPGSSLSRTHQRRRHMLTHSRQSQCKQSQQHVIANVVHCARRVRALPTPRANAIIFELLSTKPASTPMLA